MRDKPIALVGCLVGVRLFTLLMDEMEEEGKKGDKRRCRWMQLPQRRRTQFALSDASPGNETELGVVCLGSTR